MAFWILVIILSYLFFSIASLGDKLVLGKVIDAKTYTFYVGVLGLFAVLLIPFAQFSFPEPIIFVWIALASITNFTGLYLLFSAIKKFEVSRVLPVAGALQPILILIFTALFFGGQTIGRVNMLAFAILLLGSIIISIEKKLNLTKSFLKITGSAAIFISLGFIFSKLVFLDTDFVSGLVFLGIGGCLCVLVFLFEKSFRQKVFSGQGADVKKSALVLSTQASGALAGILQNFAISIAPVSGLAVMNALRGVQYVFLFALVVLISHWKPNLLKESFSRKAIIQKLVAMMLIIVGLVILTYT